MDNLFDRINVVGTSGSGKTTLAKLISVRLGHIHIEMDELFWEANWGQPSDTVFFQKLETALKISSKWVLDGNYDRSLPIKWRNVTAVVWVDYSFMRTLLQAIRRVFKNWLKGEGFGVERKNRESLRKSFFTRDSILLWTIKTHKSNRIRYESRMNDSQYQRISFFRLRNAREANLFMESLVPASTSV